MSGPIYGLCPVGRDWLKESSGNPQTGRDWVRAPPDAPRHLDDSDNVMTHLAHKKINAFSGVGHGFYFWNFRTDLEEPHWSYMLALEKGWIPKGNLNDEKIQSACDREDKGEFKCILKHKAAEEYVRNAVEYILDAENRTNTEKGRSILSMQGDNLEREANELIGEYFEKNRGIGATCDFGGVAMLVEEDREIIDSDDDRLWNNDDEYYGETITIYRGPTTLALVLTVIGAALLGSVIGFIVAMRTNKGFNRKVRESVFFRPISQSKIPLIRSSLALPEFSNYDELQGLIPDNEIAR